MRKILILLVLALAVSFLSTSCESKYKDRYEELLLEHQAFKSEFESVSFQFFEKGYQMGAMHILEYEKYKRKKWQEDSAWFMDMHFPKRFETRILQ